MVEGLPRSKQEQIELAANQSRVLRIVLDNPLFRETPGTYLIDPIFHPAKPEFFMDIEVDQVLFLGLA